MEITAGLVAIADPTDVAEARRRAADLAARLAFDAVTAGRVAIAVTEAGTNLLKHAGGGDLFVGIAGPGNRPGLQMVAMDRGHGVKDLPGSLRDGFSTAGTAGTGLGAIRRASSTFDIYTAAGGTVLAATFFGNGQVLPPVGAVCAALAGERVCGDAWAMWSAGELTSIFLCDGLGHGADAAVAADTAVTAFRRHAERPADEVLTYVHEALRSTRGAAVALAELDHRHQRLVYCGLGNISATIVRLDGAEQHLVSLSGIAGHVMRRMQPFTYEWPRGSLLVMHTDGVSARWSLKRYAGLAARREDVIAGVLFRDHRRERDDATVVVARSEGIA
jgi:anti-sigma regulatory factor (Ser/Thr protein kinase)